MFAGEVKPRHEADLGFRIGGKIVARSVDVGARVTQGPGARAPRSGRRRPAGRGARRPQVAATETEISSRRPSTSATQHLFEQKFISASALDAKRNALDANRAKYEQAKANLAVSQNQASYAALIATEDGVVTSVNGRGRARWSPPGQSVVRIAREDEREVAISVPENRIGELKRADGARASRCGRIRSQACTAARVREDRAGGGSRDAHVRRARGDRRCRRGACSGA